MGPSPSRTAEPPSDGIGRAGHATANNSSNSDSNSSSAAATMQPTSSESSSTSASAGISYTFPQQKLKRRLEKPGKTPLVLVACGSFSPITILHLQLFELAQRYVERTEFEIVGCYVSPCSDMYGKSSLVASSHRINMCVSPPLNLCHNLSLCYRMRGQRAAAC